MRKNPVGCLLWSSLLFRSEAFKKPLFLELVDQTFIEKCLTRAAGADVCASPQKSP